MEIHSFYHQFHLNQVETILIGTSLQEQPINEICDILSNDVERVHESDRVKSEHQIKPQQIISLPVIDFKPFSFCTGSCLVLSKKRTNPTNAHLPGSPMYPVHIIIFDLIFTGNQDREGQLFMSFGIIVSVTR